MTSDDIKPVALSLSSAALLTVSQAAIGCGIGILLAGRIDENKRNIAAIAILSFAFAATLPPVVSVVADLVNGPRSKLGVRRRLRSIREGSGIQAEEEAY
jgi:ABC-type molybdate transport system permease subunit